MIGAIRGTDTEQLYQELELALLRIDADAYFTKYTKIILHPIFIT